VKRKWVEVEAAKNAKCTVITVYLNAESADRVRHSPQQVGLFTSKTVFFADMIGKIAENSAHFSSSVGIFAENIPQASDK